MSESDADWLSRVEARFLDQLRRAGDLVDAAVEEVPGSTGFASTNGRGADILRAAVILLHAALEDLVRSIQDRRLPDAPAEALNRIDLPMPDGAPKPKVGLGTFAVQFRGLTVREAVRACVEAHLERKTFNNPDDLARGLKDVGVADPAAVLGDDAGRIKLLTTRRHQIAHRADDDPAPGAGATAPVGIDAPTLLEWAAAVRRVGERTVRAVRDLERIPEETTDVD